MFYVNTAFIIIVSPILTNIMTTNAIKPVVNPTVPLKVRRMTARLAPPSRYPMIPVE
jgi:hypothetical protein